LATGCARGPAAFAHTAGDAYELISGRQASLNEDNGCPSSYV